MSLVLLLLLPFLVLMETMLIDVSSACGTSEITPTCTGHLFQCLDGLSFKIAKWGLGGYLHKF